MEAREAVHVHKSFVEMCEGGLVDTCEAVQIFQCPVEGRVGVLRRCAEGVSCGDVCVGVRLCAHVF